MKTEFEKILTDGLDEENKKWLIKSFKDLSYDDTEGGDEGDCYDCSHPTTSGCRAISYDNLAMLHQVQLGSLKRLRSCDALYIGNILSRDGQPEIYLIEFKNGIITDSVVKDINDKIRESVQLFNSLNIISNGKVDLSNQYDPKLKMDCDDKEKLNLVTRFNSMGVEGDFNTYCRQHMNFILVYNENKKTELLDSDLESIIDDINEGIVYRELEEAIEICLTDEINKKWLYSMAKLDMGSVVSPKNVLIAILNHKKGDKNVSCTWFSSFAEVVFKQKQIVKGEKEVFLVAEIWDLLTFAQRKDIYIKLKDRYTEWESLNRKDPRKKREIGIALSIKDFIGSINIGDIESITGRDFLLYSLCTSIKNPSLRLYEKVECSIKNKKALNDFERGEYDKDIEALMEFEFLIPIDFRNDLSNLRERATAFIKDKINNNKIEEFKQELRGGRPANKRFALHFVNGTQQTHRFFRFHQWEKIYVKSTSTYGRREFQDCFIEDICHKKCMDYGA